MYILFFLSKNRKCNRSQRWDYIDEDSTDFLNSLGVTPTIDLNVRINVFLLLYPTASYTSLTVLLVDIRRSFALLMRKRLMYSENVTEVSFLISLDKYDADVLNFSAS